MGQLSATLNPLGWTIPILPEMDDLTVGESVELTVTSRDNYSVPKEKETGFFPPLKYNHFDTFPLDRRTSHGNGDRDVFSQVRSFPAHLRLVRVGSG